MTRGTPAGTITVTALCEMLGVSRSGYYAARRASERDREVAVVTPSRTEERSAEARDDRPPPRGRRPAASVERVVAAVREVVANHPAWGVRKVWAMLRRDGLVVARKRV